MFQFILYIMYLSNHGDFLFHPAIHNAAPPPKKKLGFGGLLFYAC